MRISYIPENILKVRSDCKFFFGAPFKAAIYNFKVSVHASHIKEHDKFQEKAVKVEGVAKPAIEGTKRASKISLCNRVAHFFAHVGIGLLLFIPLLNFIPFVILALKAKEHREVAPEPPETELKEVVVEKEVGAKPFKAPVSKPIPQKPVQALVQSAANIQSAKLTAEPEDTVLRDLHRNAGDVNASPAAKVKERADVVVDLFFPLFVSEIPADVLDDISTWFSIVEEKTQTKTLPAKKIQEFFTLDAWVQKSDKLNSIRRKIRDNINYRLTTGCFGKGPLDKIQNVEAKLKYFRQFLNEKFPEYVDAPLRASYNSLDPRIMQRENPYDRVLSGVFGLSLEDFKNSLLNFEFYQKHGEIHVNPHLANG